MRVQVGARAAGALGHARAARADVRALIMDGERVYRLTLRSAATDTEFFSCKGDSKGFTVGSASDCDARLDAKYGAAPYCASFYPHGGGGKWMIVDRGEREKTTTLWNAGILDKVQLLGASAEVYTDTTVLFGNNGPYVISLRDESGYEALPLFVQQD